MSIKRVLLVHHGSNWGGAPIALLLVAKALRDSQEFEPYLLFSAEGTASTRAREVGFPVFVQPTAVLGCSVSRHSLHLRDVLRFACVFFPSFRGLTRTIRDLNIDLVYLNTSTLVGPAVTAHVNGIPIVWHVREVLHNDSPSARRLISFVCQYADAVVANSDYATRALGECGKATRVYDGIPFHRIERSGTSVVSLRQEWNCSPDSPLIGVVSAVARIKGHFVLLEAIPHVLRRFPDTRFVVVGGSIVPEGYGQTLRGRLRRLLKGQYDPLEQLVRLARERGVERSIHFAGWRWDIPVVMSALDVLVFPSVIAEGFGRPQIEAGMAGVPVVASDIGPARELVEDQVTGILFPPGDVRRLAESIIALLEDRQRARDMGHAGRKRAESHFSEAIHARSMLAVFHRVADGSAAARRTEGSRMGKLLETLRCLFVGALSLRSHQEEHAAEG